MFIAAKIIKTLQIQPSTSSLRVRKICAGDGRSQQDQSISRQLETSSLLQHDINTHNPGEDFHSTQIMKVVISMYLHTKLFRYGQEYTRNVLRAGTLSDVNFLNIFRRFHSLFHAHFKQFYIKKIDHLLGNAS